MVALFLLSEFSGLLAQKFITSGIERQSILIAIALFAFLIILVGELSIRFVLRFFAPDLARRSTRIAMAVQPDRWRFRPHAFTQYTGNPNYFKSPGWVDDLGFQNKNYTRKKPTNIFRILCFGGSTTAWGYPKYLEEYLNRFGKPSITYEVLNFGLDGYTSTHSLINLMLNGIDYSPDVVVFEHAWNDAHPRNSSKNSSHTFRSDYSHFFKAFDAPIPADAFLIRLSVIYRALRNFIRPISGRRYFQRAVTQYTNHCRPFTEAKELAPLLRNLRTAIDISHGRGIQFILTTQPHSIDSKKERFGYSEHIGQANEQIRLLAKSVSTKAKFVDLDWALTTKKEELFLDVGHMSEAGKATKAQLIGEAVIGEEGSEFSSLPKRHKEFVSWATGL